jgi:hypothetical protein
VTFQVVVLRAVEGGEVGSEAKTPVRSFPEASESSVESVVGQYRTLQEVLSSLALLGLAGLGLSRGRKAN